MRWKIIFVFGLPLWAVAASPPADSVGSAEQTQARVYLKQRLLQLNLEFPFSTWARRLDSLNNEIDGFLAHHQPMRYDPALRPELLRFSAALDSARAERPQVQSLIHEMYVQIMVGRIQEAFRRDGKTLSPQGRDALYRALKPYEAGSLRPKTDFLAQLVSLDRKFSHAYSTWLFEWAGAWFPHLLATQSQDTGFAAEEAQRQDLALQLEYWTRQIDSGGAAQAVTHFRQLQTELLQERPRALADLRSMEANLDPDMLLSDLLEEAQKEGLSFTVEAEERVEAALDARGQSVLLPMRDKIDTWMRFDQALQNALTRAQATVDRNQQAITAHAAEEQQEQQAQQELAARTEQEQWEQQRQAEEQREREEQQQQQEQARLAALAAEQDSADAAEREQAEQTLAEWKSLQAGGALAGLDGATDSALAVHAGTLKTSTVASGRTRLQVASRKFSDTLAFVEKFTVDESHIDLSKLSLDQKASQSAYVYTSPTGRTNPRDLDQFVQNVALGSFNTEYRFLSYLVPERLRCGRDLAWEFDRSSQPVVHDRVFSYVDLVDDAHHKHAKGTGTPAEGAEMNLPANLIVIFDAQGGIMRYQSFGHPDQIFIRPQDLVDGRLHYKFLNYSVDRENIYLNGIDPEIKVSAPASG